MLALDEGRWIGRQDEILVGSRLALTKQLRPGDTVLLNDRRFTVAGIGNVRGSGLAGTSGLFMDYDAFLDTTGEPDIITFGAVRSQTPVETRDDIAELRRLNVLTQEEVIELGQGLASSDQFLYMIFSILALVVAGLFVGNVLTMSVNERRIEFATLRAIGISRRTIFLTVMTEALAIALTAYALGAVLGMALSSGIATMYYQTYGLMLATETPPSVFLQVLAIDIALGVIAGFLPTRAALAVQPVVALREA
jgi:putative ABC transport system permease protein